jgi:hypothetical protein
MHWSSWITRKKTNPNSWSFVDTTMCKIVSSPKGLTLSQIEWHMFPCLYVCASLLGVFVLVACLFLVLCLLLSCHCTILTTTAITPTWPHCLTNPTYCAFLYPSSIVKLLALLAFQAKKPSFLLFFCLSLFAYQMSF